MHKVLPILTHIKSAKNFHPDVIISKDTVDFIEDSYEHGRPLILAPNHVQYDDHNVLNAAMYHVPILSKHVVGNTVVYAKSPYFNNKKGRWYNQLSNVVPVFREQDIAEHGPKGKNSSFLAGRAFVSMLDMTLRRFEEGNNLLIFAEGTRNNDDWRKILPLEAGIGNIAFRAWHSGLDVSILPIGIAYKDKSPLSIDNPVVKFGDPILKRPDKADVLTGTVAIAIQKCVNSAYLNLDHRK